MKKSMLFAAALACLPFSAFAQGNADQCTGIVDDQSRLTCYDGLFRPKIENSTPSPSAGKWGVTTETSPIDDSKRVFLSLAGREGIRNQYGQDAQITFTIACRENHTSMWFHFGGQFMSDLQGAGRVTYRIDSAPAQAKNFTESSNHEALGLWNGGTSIPFLKSLFGKQQLFVQAIPYSESAVNDFFDIAGLEEAIKPLREACHW